MFLVSFFRWFLKLLLANVLLQQMVVVRPNLWQIYIFCLWIYRYSSADLIHLWCLSFNSVFSYYFSNYLYLLSLCRLFSIAYWYSFDMLCISWNLRSRLMFTWFMYTSLFWLILLISNYFCLLSAYFAVLFAWIFF